MSNINQPNDIELRPKPIYFAIKNFFVLLLAFVVLILAFNFKSNYVPIKYVGVLTFFILMIYLSYKYIDTVICTRWVITDEQIKIYKGVFFRSVNYIELYRVNDYEEKKSFIQLIFKNTNVLIASGDRSTPVLLITGIVAGSNVIDKIRQRVEVQKKIKGVYEITNRN